jgi:hypothetical protein
MPSKSIRFTAMPNTALFGTGQARFVQTSVVVDNTNHLYDQAIVQLLNTQNQEGPIETTIEPDKKGGFGVLPLPLAPAARTC